MLIYPGMEIPGPVYGPHKPLDEKAKKLILDLGLVEVIPKLIPNEDIIPKPL